MRFCWVVICVGLLSPRWLLGQNDAWEHLQYFEGEWEGDETGDAGVGRGQRTYRFVMGGKYLIQENESRFEPQERNPGGEVHEDLGIFSLDMNSAKVVFRQFHIEGFVIRFVLSDHREPDAFQFVSQAIENGSTGQSARLEIEITGEDEFRETFQVFRESGERQLRLANVWRRVDRRN